MFGNSIPVDDKWKCQQSNDLLLGYNLISWLYRIIISLRRSPHIYSAVSFRARTSSQCSFYIKHWLLTTTVIHTSVNFVRSRLFLLFSHFVYLLDLIQAKKETALFCAKPFVTGANQLLQILFVRITFDLLHIKVSILLRRLQMLRQTSPQSQIDIFPEHRTACCLCASHQFRLRLQAKQIPKQ